MEVRLHDLEAGLDVGADLAIREPQNDIAVLLQPPLTRNLARGDFWKALVNATVDFDGDLRMPSGEVGKIGTDGRLPPEIGVELPQFTPEMALAPGRPPPKASRLFSI